MTNPNYVKGLLIIDHSGSMSPLRADVIGGYNRFVEDQKKIPGKFDLTLAQFDSLYREIYADRPIQDVQPLTEADYQPQGSTALLYAVDRAVRDFGARLAALPEDERPGKVIVVIHTDGEENSSPREVTREAVKALVEQQQTQYNWEFQFFGAGIDAFQEAGGIGIKAVHTTRVDSTPDGVRQAYCVTSANFTRSRTGTA